jgi:biopolymer transport protein ExbD
MRRGQTRFGLLALRKKNLTLSGIDLWGLVGVLIALLCILMVSGPPHHHGAGVDRATALHSNPMPGAIREDALQILVTRDGSIYFGNSRVTAEILPEEIRKRVQNGAERKIYLAVDARAKYSEVEEVLDQIRLTGIQDVSLLTDQPSPPR